MVLLNQIYLLVVLAFIFFRSLHFPNNNESLPKCNNCNNSYALETLVQQSRQYAQQLLQAVLKEAFETGNKNYKENKELSIAAE